MRASVCACATAIVHYVYVSARAPAQARRRMRQRPLRLRRRLRVRDVVPLCRVLCVTESHVIRYAGAKSACASVSAAGLEARALVEVEAARKSGDGALPLRACACARVGCEFDQCHKHVLYYICICICAFS